MSVFSRFAFVFFASIMAMALDAAPLSKYEPVAGRQVIEQAFPDVTRVIPRKGNRAIQELYVRKELVGYAYQSLDFVQTPAYSGKPVNLLIAIDPSASLRLAVSSIDSSQPAFLHPCSPRSSLSRLEACS